MSDQAPTPSTPTAAGDPSQDHTNQKPPPFVVPVPHFREPELAQEELTVGQAVQAADNLIAVARPAIYRQYPILIGQLRAYCETFRAYSAYAEYDFNRASLFMKDLSSISMKSIDDLVARDAARKAVGESWRQWWSIYDTFKNVTQRYATLAQIKDDLTSGVSRPPPNPPKLV